MNKSIRVCIALGVLAVAFVHSTVAKSPLKVVVPIEPYRMFVEIVGGDEISVRSVLSGGMDPHHFVPTGQQMRFVSEADVYFDVGLPFERQMIHKYLRSNQTRKVSLLHETPEMAEREEQEHEHRHEGHHHHHHVHDHDSIDPHSWTSPNTVIEQIEIIQDALTELRPEAEYLFEERGKRLISRLRDLDAEFKKVTENKQGRKLLVYHPAWGHFCEAYGLEQVAVEKEGKPMGAKDFARLLESFDDHTIPVLLVQPQINDRLSEQVAKQFALTVVKMDPLAYDYFETMDQLMAVLRL